MQTMCNKLFGWIKYDVMGKDVSELFDMMCDDIYVRVKKRYVIHSYFLVWKPNGTFWTDKISISINQDEL